MVSATATDVDCSILAGMTPTVVTLDAMRSAMRLAGFAWSDAELDALRPGLERARCGARGGGRPRGRTGAGPAPRRSPRAEGSVQHGGCADDRRLEDPG